MPTWVWIVIAVVVVLAIALGTGPCPVARRRRISLRDARAGEAGGRAAAGEGRVPGRRFDLVLVGQPAVHRRGPPTGTEVDGAAGGRRRRGGAARFRDPADRRRDPARGHRSTAEPPPMASRRSVRAARPPSTPRSPTALAARPRPARSTPSDRRGPAPAPSGSSPAAGRLNRLRGRLSRSQNVVRAESLLGPARRRDPRRGLLDRRRGHPAAGRPRRRGGRGDHRRSCAPRSRRRGAVTAPEARALLRRVLIEAVGPDDGPRRCGRCRTTAGRRCVLVVGVNGTGKTTTTGKLARVLVADGRHVVLGAADTFRAAAADQLATWGERAGARRRPGGAGHRPGGGRVRRGQARHRRRRGRRADRHRRPAAHQDRPDGRARQGQAGRREAGGGRRGVARAGRHHRARTAWCRRPCSPTSSTSPASC